MSTRALDKMAARWRRLLDERADRGKWSVETRPNTTSWLDGSRFVLVALLILSVAAGALNGQEQPEQPSASAKRVEIDKTHQVLRAYEGDELVFQSRVSTGKGDSTPNGNYQVEGKQRMHYSRRYDNAPMPYSVQVSGHYFIHGFSYVPHRPASHGCIRVPLSDGNPAKVFYEWVELGTPIEITGRWP